MKYKIVAMHSASGYSKDERKVLDTSISVKDESMAWIVIRYILDAVLEETYNEYAEITISYTSKCDLHEFKMWRSEDNEYSFVAEIDGETKWMGSRWDEYLSGWL